MKIQGNTNMNWLSRKVIKVKKFPSNNKLPSFYNESKSLTNYLNPIPSYPENNYAYVKKIQLRAVLKVQKTSSLRNEVG